MFATAKTMIKFFSSFTVKEGLFSFLKGESPINSFPLFLIEPFFPQPEKLLILILFHQDILLDISFSSKVLL